MNLACSSLPFAVTLRPIGREDSEFLFSVYASTRTTELAQVAWADEQKEEFLRSQFEAQRRCFESDYPGAQFQIILVDGQPAGRLYVHRRPAEIRIMDIALLPPFRGRGIATAFLKDILAEGERTARRASIHVEVFNPALRLYQRLGFTGVALNGVYQLLEWIPKSTRQIGTDELHALSNDKSQPAAPSIQKNSL
jgi:GNAT superfamily N-acetyltransferase